MGNYDDGVGFDRDHCGCAYREPANQRLGDQSFEDRPSAPAHELADDLEHGGAPAELPH
jgi:hypothetical protein